MVELETPPNTDVIWLAAKLDNKATCAVKAQSWYKAREKAAIALNCDPQELDVQRVEPNKGPYPQHEGC